MVDVVASTKVASKVSPWRRYRADPATWFSEHEVAEAKAYLRPLNRVGYASTLVSIAVFAAVVGSHLPVRLAGNLGLSSWWQRLMLTLGVVMLIDTVATVAFSAWSSLVYEKRSGMSTQTPARFATDQVKNLLVSFVMLSLLLVPVWALVRSTSLWWLWAVAVMAGFTLLMVVLGPLVIDPLFNKDIPLEEGELRSRLFAMVRDTGADISEIRVRDASKRSRRDNAFVAGLGPTRRLVLFDTLIDKPIEHVVAVCAHEIGHWKRHHIRRTLPMALVSQTLMLALAAAVISWHPLLRFAGVKSLQDGAAVSLLLFAFGVLFTLTALPTAWISRCHERDADIFALETTEDVPTFQAMMRNLYVGNRADLAPPAIKRIRATHPPVAERLALAQAWASMPGPG